MKALIDAPSLEKARAIAEESLDGDRDDVEWSSFDGDGEVVDVEEAT